MENTLPICEDGLYRAPGYPELAFLISTDMDFSIYRKFDELSARNLLKMQADLTAIEEELRLLDNAKTRDLHIMDVARKESLSSRLQILLNNYQKALLRQNQIHELGTPSQDMAGRLDFWIRNAAMRMHVGRMKRYDFQPSHPMPGSGPENPSHFWRTRDYVCLKSRPIPDTWIERFTRKRLGRWFRDDRPIPAHFDGYYFSRSKFERVKDWMAFPLGLVFLIAPATLFFFICSPSTRLAVLLAFITGLALVAQIFLGTTRHETLATALGYTGVLGLLISVKTNQCPVSA
ncbi:hypothetical protein E6O75_ATG10505 [Venturia nashicola]|uniref:DUF6594 domain-containing protein n=1 Tax=Venturia nashicola TaxID=86259 RepID=A0A4Z1NPZ9_9PEZI|nr:hypothetical protein E6O75_ATG10505 [Venturia nashicola]